MRNVCTVEGCERFVAGRGLCRNHYYAQPDQREKVRLQRERIKLDKARPRCVAPDCDRAIEARGLCPKHYRWEPDVRAKRMQEARERSATPEIKRRARERNQRPDVRARNFECGKRRRLRLKYGLTVEAFDQMHSAQGGRCAICQTNSEPLVVDHDHATGMVRALLCDLCNRGIGFFRDDPLRLMSAAEYVAGFISPKSEVA